MKLVGKISAHILLVLIVFFNTSIAESLPEVEALVRNLRSLRNTDKSYEKATKWRDLERDFQELIQANEDRDPKLEFYYGFLQYELGKRTGEQGRFKQAYNIFLGLHRFAPQSEWTEEALYRGAQICKNNLQSITCEQRAFNLLKKEFPRSKYILLFQAKGVLPPPHVVFVRRIVDSEPIYQEKRPIIVIDPGHGGEDDGAVGIAGIREKDLTLALSRQIEQQLVTSGCCEVILTRTHDVFVPIIDRSAIANQNDADLFLSIHVNTTPKLRSSASGLEVYYVSQNANADAIDLVSRENAQGSGSANDVLHGILIDLYQRGAELASQPFAEHVHHELHQSLRDEWPTVRARGVKKGPFYALMGVQMPAVLLEILFLSHEQDVQLLVNKGFRRDVGRAVAHSIESYLEKMG